MYRLLLAAGVLSPVLLLGGITFAGLGWHEGSRVADVLARGIAVEARIDGGSRSSRRRSATTFVLNLSWVAPDGAALRAEGVSISSELADRIFIGERIARPGIAIKYLADDPENPIVLEDAQTGMRGNERALQWGIALALVGAGGAGFTLWSVRRIRAAAGSAA